MPLFRYEAVDREGKTLHGAMLVPDEQTVTTRLASMGYQTTQVHLSHNDQSTVARRTITPVQTMAATPRHTSAAPTGPVSLVSTDDQSRARMLYQLHMSLRAGMPIYQALTTVESQVYNPVLRKVLQEISVGIRDGGTLSEMTRRYPRIFTPGDVGMIHAAERGGFLPDAMKMLADQHEEDSKAGRSLTWVLWLFLHSNALCLPFVIAGAAFFTGAAKHDLSVPAGVHAMWHTFFTVSVPMLIGYVLLMIFLPRWIRNLRHSPTWHRSVLRYPITGPLNRARAKAVFTRTLQYLYRSGVNSTTAWETSAGAVPNLHLAEQLRAGTQVVEATGRFSTAIQHTGLLEPTDAGMVATGEATGEVPQALDYLANRYEDESRVALQRARVRAIATIILWGVILMGVGAIIGEYSMQAPVRALLDSLNS